MRASLPHLLLPALLCLLATPAQAHSRSVSYSTWQVESDGVRAEVRLPTSALNLAGLDPGDLQTANMLAQRVLVDFSPRAETRTCVADGAKARRDGSVFVINAYWRCAGAVDELQSTFLLDVVPGHLHLLQLRTLAGELRGPYALSAAQTRLAIAADNAPPSFGSYLQLGTRHILTGWDHLAFLVVLVLGAAGLRQLAWRVTGFTAGHSLTLALATLGGLRPPAVMIESFIALTIACTAAERVLSGHRRAALHAVAITGVLALAGWLSGALPWLLLPASMLLSLGADADARLASLRTALFGLFHGFGFAGVLGELNYGQAVPAGPLFSFNLGVECGQLLFVLPLWAALRRWPHFNSPLLAAAVLALGSGWFVYRITGNSA